MLSDVFWATSREPGLEHLHMVEGEAGVEADGLVLGVAGGTAFRLAYQVRAGSEWAVRECRLRVGGADQRELRILGDGRGRWTDGKGETLPALDGCIDVDIQVTPFTNTLPIRRLGLAAGASAEIVVAYLSVPELGVRSVRQRYTCLAWGEDGGVYRYEGLETGFRADVSVDAQGLVVEYGGIWRRVWTSGA
jgi:uncharacterized protein